MVEDKFLVRWRMLDKESQNQTNENEVGSKYLEVLTDEAMVVGPDDKENGLEASPANCGILTFVDKQRHVIGVAHCSRFVDKEIADKLINAIKNGFFERGGNLDEAKIEGYNFLGENLDTILDSLKEITGIAPLIDSELIMGTTIRVDKNNGEVRDIEYGAKGVEIKPFDVEQREYIDNYWDDEEERRLTEAYGWDELDKKEPQPEEKRLVNPSGNQDAMQIIQIDDKTLEIRWIRKDFMPTRFSAIGPEAEMYEYIKGRYPDLKKSILAAFSIITDEDGKPLAVGERGVSASMVKRIKEEAN